MTPNQNETKNTKNLPDTTVLISRFTKTSEFIAIVQLLVVWVLELNFPSSTTSSNATTAITIIPSDMSTRIITSLILLLFGMYIINCVHKELYRCKQTQHPWETTTHLVTTGPFHYSRHPTYTAIVFLITPSVGILLDSMWIFYTIPISFLVFYFYLIQDEERKLKSKFPTEWNLYCSRTRMWI